MANDLSGQIDLGTDMHAAPREGVALASDTDVASFTDANHTDTASNFTASIDWGDGTITSGAVVGSNGSFQIQGGHTYVDEGSVQPTVTIVRTTDNATIAPTAFVSVADTDNLTGHSPPNAITGNPNVALNNVEVATFTDSNTQNVPGDFTVAIDWGDGTTTTGTLNGSGNTYTVTGSHTYAIAGQFTITTFMNDDGPDAATGVATTTAGIGFGGTETLQSATEGEAVPTGTQVATFVDNKPGTTAADYTVKIDWGDGTTTDGTVSGGSGSFTITSAADHAYADEANFTLTANITRTADSAHTSASGTVSVAENDALTATGTTIHNSNLVLSNVTVATFSDKTIDTDVTNTSNVASDFVASIDWGDGITTSGIVSGSAGAFTVTGSHTYAQGGQYEIGTLVKDDPDANAFANATTTSTAIVGLSAGTGTSFSIPEGGPTGPIPVATFNDGNQSEQASDFTANIDWGDGTTTPGVVSGSNGSFTVSSAAGHTYADEASETITTTVTRTADHALITITGEATVNEADSLAISVDNISGNPGQPFNNVPVAQFSTSYLGNVASDFIASIDWGDGTPATTGSISGSNGNFVVSGSHTYANGGSDTLTVTVADDTPGTASITGTGSATINFQGHMVLTSATEGTALPNNTPVATFTDSNGGDTPASFSAQIDWGDGTTTSGTVSGGAGTFTVAGGHTYADEGSDTATVTVTHTSDMATSTVSGSVAVQEADSLTPHASTFGAVAGQNFNGPVATFGDSYTGNVPGDFIAAIDWGDGTSSTGTVSGGNGTFTVSGSHTYAAPGQDTVTVVLNDDAPGTAMATSSSTAMVLGPSHMVLNSATEGTALPSNTPVAVFSDANLSDTTSSFTASIDWGDGVTTPGTIVGAAGTFTVEGGHTYADEGNDTATVTLTHTSDQAKSTVSGPVAVAENDVLTGHPTAIAATQGQVFNGTVATFDDTFAGNVPGDFVAAINWGDGTSSVGTVSGGNGSFTVSGSHTYAATGQDNVTVTLSDDAPGTATATAMSTAVVVAAFPTTNFGAGDFDTDGDKNGDLLWQNADGSVATWDMNGAQISGQTTLGQLPSNWHLAGVGHFNPNLGGGSGFGNTDALFHSDSGGVVMWQIVNNHVVTNQLIGQVPTNWHVIGLGDFNGDGPSDVLWQSDAGQMLMWEMNGPHVVLDQIFGQAPAGGTAVAVADFNNDGKADILFQTDSGGIVMWEMNGTQIIANQTVGQLPTNWPLRCHRRFQWRRHG